MLDAQVDFDVVETNRLSKVSVAEMAQTVICDREEVLGLLFENPVVLFSDPRLLLFLRAPPCPPIR
ncbi:MAG: hypothetical protein ACI88C_000106 [Acidimicrobiales bacterium]